MDFEALVAPTPSITAPPSAEASYASSDRFPLMSSSQCRSVSNVQDLFHTARCKSGIVPVLPAEAQKGYGELTTDSASRVKSGFHKRRGDPFNYFVGHRYSGR